MSLDPCGVITLMTDFGMSDHFVGVMKGVILNIDPQSQIVDITHAVPPQDIHGAAFLINSAYRYFPAGTIHVVVVDPGVGSQRRAIVCETDTAYFVCPDNGVLSYILSANTTHRVVALDTLPIGCLRLAVRFTAEIFSLPWRHTCHVGFRPVNLAVRQSTWCDCPSPRLKWRRRRLSEA